MSEIPGPEIDNEDPVDEEQVSLEETRRNIGIQVAAGMVGARGEGITSLLEYAAAIEQFLADGTMPDKKPVGETSTA